VKQLSYKEYIVYAKMEFLNLQKHYSTQSR